MAFNDESIFLNLKCAAHTLKYQEININEKESLVENIGIFDESSKQINSDMLTSHTILHFKELPIIKKDIKNLCLHFNKTLNNEKRESEFPFFQIVSRVNIILQGYTEQPSLLDSVLPNILVNIFEQARLYLKHSFILFINSSCFPSKEIVSLFDQLSYIVYSLCNLRGLKNIRVYMPNNVDNLEIILFCLVSQKNNLSWESKYFLLIWLSVLLLVPFDFQRFDFSTIFEYYYENIEKFVYNEIEQLIMSLLKNYLNENAKIGKVTSMCINILFKRINMNDSYSFKEFLTWVFDICSVESTNSINLKTISWLALRKTIKGLSKDLLIKNYSWIKSQMDLYNFYDFSKINSSVYLYQKLGFMFIFIERILINNPFRPIYLTANKKILENENNENKVQMITNSKNCYLNLKEFNDSSININKNLFTDELNQELIENIQYLDIIELSIEICLENLSNKDSNVRYLIAKYISNICQKLSKNLSDQIINLVFSKFEMASEELLHGICLIIGESIRKKILSPDYLPTVIIILEKSLIFEEYDVNHSTGSIIRDSACYISWALARSFESSIMKEYVIKFGTNLLMCALFDKNTNCRKAAAASFQENVGRQGYFLNGIEIISEMDFFSVSRISNSYLQIAPFVASFKNYTISFINYLAFNRSLHIEKNIRILSGKSLGLVSLLDTSYCNEFIIPKLIELTLSKTVNKRHGALYSISCILQAYSGNIQRLIEKDKEIENIFLRSLSINEQKLVKSGIYLQEFQNKFNEQKNKNIVDLIPINIVNEILEIPSLLIEKDFFKGKGGEITRIGVLNLIKGCSICKFKINEIKCKIWIQILEECLRTTIEDIHKEVYQALEIFSKNILTYFKDLEINMIENFIKKIQFEKIKDIKKAFVKAISTFDSQILLIKYEIIIELLCNNAKIKKDILMNDAEIRVVSVYSFIEIFIKIMPFINNINILVLILDTLIATGNDYTVDKRGDIGMLVREETCYSIEKIWNAFIINKFKNEYFDIWINSYIEKELGFLLTLLFEPNDRIRLSAGLILQNLICDLFISLPLFENKYLFEKKFNSNYLKEKFEIFQNKYYKIYDVSLLDNNQYLSYTLNNKFVYFWNVEYCAFSHINEFININRLNYFIMKGIILSIGSISIENQENVPLNNLIIEIQNNKNLILLCLESLYKIIKLYKNKEKFFVCCANTLYKLSKCNFIKEIIEDNLIIDILIEFINIIENYKTHPRVKLLVNVNRINFTCSFK